MSNCEASRSEETAKSRADEVPQIASRFDRESESGYVGPKAGNYQWINPLLRLMAVASEVSNILESLHSDARFARLGHFSVLEKNEKDRKNERAKALLRDTDVLSLLLVVEACEKVTMTRVSHLYTGETSSREFSSENQRRGLDAARHWLRDTVLPVVRDDYPLVKTSEFKEVVDPESVIWRVQDASEPLATGKRRKVAPRANEVVIEKSDLLEAVIGKLEPVVRQRAEALCGAFLPDTFVSTVEDDPAKTNLEESEDDNSAPE